MKKLIYLLTFALMTGISLHAADESSKEMGNTEVVAAGTYSGIAERVDPKEKEVYFKTADGRTVELYFKDDTKLTQDGKPAKFEALKKGQKLEVTVEKKEGKNVPVAVKIDQE